MDDNKRVWIIPVKRVTKEDNLGIHAHPPKKKCLQPKKIEDIFSMGFLLIPLVVPYDQNLLSRLSFCCVGRALRPSSILSVLKMQVACKSFIVYIRLINPYQIDE